MKKIFLVLSCLFLCAASASTSHAEVPEYDVASTSNATRSSERQELYQTEVPEYDVASTSNVTRSSERQELYQTEVPEYDVASASNATRSDERQELYRIVEAELSKIPYNVSSGDVYDRSSAMDYVLHYVSGEFIDKYNIEIFITDFSPATVGNLQDIYGKEGRFTVKAKIYFDETDIRYVYYRVRIVSDYKVPDDEVQNVTWSRNPLVDSYFKQCFEKLIQATKDGVPMSQVNTPTEEKNT